MTGQELINGIASLAKSQGSYGRLLKHLENVDRETIERVASNFNDMLDFILAYEG